MCSYYLCFISDITPLFSFLQRLIWVLNFLKIWEKWGSWNFSVPCSTYFKNHYWQAVRRRADFCWVIIVKLYIVWIWYNVKTFSQNASHTSDFFVFDLFKFCLFLTFFSGNLCSYGKCCATLADLRGWCHWGYHHHYASRRFFWVMTSSQRLC